MFQSHTITACALAAMLGLAGCAAVTYESPALDAPSLDTPTFVAKPGLIVYDQNPPCPETLEEGQSCFAIVRAASWYSDTGVRVKADQAYCFWVRPGQVWFDAGRSNSPPKGEGGSPLMNAFKYLKRDKDADWFDLIAGVVDTQAKTVQASDDIASRRLLEHVNLGRDKAMPLTVRSGGGALVMFPTDAAGATDRRYYFYENNTGQIWARVTRVRSGEACPAAAGQL